LCTPVQIFSTPPDGATTEYQISNCGCSVFLCTYYCDFPNNVYRWEVCSLVVMGNGKQVPPVLQCLKKGIAFVSSFFFYLLFNPSCMRHLTGDFLNVYQLTQSISICLILGLILSTCTGYHFIMFHMTIPSQLSTMQHSNDILFTAFVSVPHICLIILMM